VIGAGVGAGAGVAAACPVVVEDEFGGVFDAVTVCAQVVAVTAANIKAENSRFLVGFMEVQTSPFSVCVSQLVRRGNTTQDQVAVRVTQPASHFRFEMRKAWHSLGYLFHYYNYHDRDSGELLRLSKPYLSCINRVLIFGLNPKCEINPGTG
jgi:hypothetical protein